QEKGTPGNLNALGAIARHGLNLKPLAGNKLAGSFFSHKLFENKSLASSLLDDDDTDQLEI
ncbi:hypothetical protein GUITHDRAFT_161079, partial [Guillardia theta CCMP2712]